LLFPLRFPAPYGRSRRGACLLQIALMSLRAADRRARVVRQSFRVAADNLQTWAKELSEKILYADSQAGFANLFFSSGKFNACACASIRIVAPFVIIGVS